jgi:23S rRNA-/tRNA-specific pseudouridylate synthase
MPAPRRDGPLEIVRVAGDRAVVFKPAGLSSERGADDAGDSLARRAEKELRWTRVWLPHRLDRPTRGLMVIAGSADEAARCGEEIRERRWTKWYIARVASRGTPAAHGADARGLIGEHRAYLKRIGRLASVVRSGGDPSRLTVLAVAATSASADESHVLLRLDTGRYHQIRVMLASLGFPLVGDTDYGAPERRTGHARRTADGSPAIDLEAIALRIDGPGGAEVFRLARHPARRDLSPEIDAALDSAIAAPTADAASRGQRAVGSSGPAEGLDGSRSTIAP